MNKTVSTRQIIFALLISISAIKLLLLPNLLAGEVERDSYIFIFIMLIFDFLVLLALLFLMNKFKNMTFIEILDHLFGRFVARCIMFLFFLFFFIKCFTMFQTTYVYLNENLYSFFSPFLFAIPLLICVVFCVSCGLNSFSRVLEFFVPLVIVGVIVALLTGVSRADFTNIFPLLDGGILKGLNLFRFANWFGDYTILIVFFGNVKEDKKFNLKVILSCLGVIVVITLFFLVFYATYGYNVVCHTNAISDILQVLPSVSDIGSFDWILILIWDIALFLCITLNFFGAYYSFRHAFFKKFPLAISIFIALLIFLVNYLLKFNVYISISFAKNYLCYFSIFVGFILPLLIFIVGLIKGGKKNEVPNQK